MSHPILLRRPLRASLEGARDTARRTARRTARGAPGRTAQVTAALAVLDLAIYTTFSHVYFCRRSPKPAAAWTAADAVATAAALPLVARIDRTAALGLAPQAGRLALATPVALYQARHNP